MNAPSAGFPDRLYVNWAHPRPVLAGDTELAVHLGGRGDPVLILHGFPESPRAFQSLAETLARDHYVILPHLPGSGSSPRPRLNGVSIVANAKRVSAMLENLGARGVTVIGHDWGAAIAFWLALTHQSNIRRLVILDTPIRGFGPRFFLHMVRMGFPVISDVLYRLGADSVVRQAFRHRVAPGFALPEDQLQSAVESWAGSEARRTAPAYFRSLRNLAVLRKFRNAWIKVPTLFIFGDREPLFGKRTIQFTLDCFEKSRTRIIKGAGHHPHIERAGEVARLVEEFLGKSGKTSQTD